MTTTDTIHEIMREHQRTHATGSECLCWQAYWAWLCDSGLDDAANGAADEVEISKDAETDLVTRLSLLADPHKQGECWPDPRAWDDRPLDEQVSDLVSLLEAE